MHHKKNRRKITPRLIALIRLRAGRGEPAEAIARDLRLTPFIVETIANANVDPHKPPPKIKVHLPHREIEQTTPVPLEDGEEWTLPRRCSGCGALMVIIPCRACRLRQHPQKSKDPTK